MNKKQITSSAAAGALVAMLGTQGILAQNGADDAITSPAPMTPLTQAPTQHSDSGETSHAGTGTSGGTGNSGSSSGTSEKSVEPIHIQSVDVKHGTSDATESRLSDDSSSKTVRVERKNGKSVAQTMINGKVSSEKELSSDESVSVSTTDASGRKHTIKIKPKDDHFELTEGATTASTKLPLTIDAKSDKLLVLTDDGTVELKVTPAKAEEELADKLDEVDSAALELENKTTVTSSKISDNPKAAPATTNVVLRAIGVKHTNFLGLFPVDAHETATVNVVTGVEKVESKPWFLNIFGFLFSGK